MYQERHWRFLRASLRGFDPVRVAVLDNGLQPSTIGVNLAGFYDVEGGSPGLALAAQIDNNGHGIGRVDFQGKLFEASRWCYSLALLIVMMRLVGRSLASKSGSTSKFHLA